MSNVKVLFLVSLVIGGTLFAGEKKIIHRIAEEETIKEVTGGGLTIEEIIEPVVDYNYASFDKEDPFIAPYIKKQKPEWSESSVKETPIISVLQEFELSELKVVGIWQGDKGERKSLIMAGTTEAVVTRVGDPIGRRSGKILAIGENSLIVREMRYGPDGTAQYEDIDMPLQRNNLGMSLSGGATNFKGNSPKMLDSFGRVQGILPPASAGVGGLGAMGGAAQVPVVAPAYNPTLPTQGQMDSNSQRSGIGGGQQVGANAPGGFQGGGSYQGNGPQGMGNQPPGANTNQMPPNMGMPGAQDPSQGMQNMPASEGQTSSPGWPTESSQ